MTQSVQLKSRFILELVVFFPLRSCHGHLAARRTPFIGTAQTDIENNMFSNKTSQF